MSKITTENILSQLGIEVGKPFLREGEQVVITQIDDDGWFWTEINGKLFCWAITMLVNCEIEVIPQPKYTLTETEKHIVLAIDEKWKWIARAENKDLSVFDTKPLKVFGENDWWNDEYENYFEAFNHHFQFIQWTDEEPVSLDELREIAKEMK